MSNDDLGQFPTPPKSPADSSSPAVDPSVDPLSPTTDTPPKSPNTSETSLLDDINTPPSNHTEDYSSPTPTSSLAEDKDLDSTFEPTPDEIPSVANHTPLSTPQSIQESSPYPPTTPETPIETHSSNNQPAESFDPSPATESYIHTTPTPPATHVEPPVTDRQEIPATIVPKGGQSFGPVILIGLLLVAGIGLAASVFLFSQSQQLKNQLIEITQTLEKQETIITPTPTPVATSTPTPFLSPTATPTATLTPVTTTSTIMPLASAPSALQVAINHEPNAQLILIKTENATDQAAAITKYYFRQNLTTKKYFYVTINSQGQSQIVDTAIYVTPDNNIPSLNDLVLGNKLGIDFDQALKIATDLCSGTTCTTASVKSQYIKSGEIVIWQLTFDPQNTSQENLVIQMNAQTKEVLYKSAGFK
jgi:hypothetical protein